MNYEPKIAKRDLLHGQYYKGKCRNASIARWDASRERFVHWRTKWGSKFTEEICHPEDEKHFDVFVVEEVCEAKEYIPFEGENNE